MIQYDRIAYFFAFAVTFDFAIQCGTFARLRMRIIGTDSVNLNVGT